jgi:hypothetical protein
VITAGGGALSGTESLHATYTPSFFAKYEKDKVMVAESTARNWSADSVQIPGYPAVSQSLSGRTDPREWYAMASYKVTAQADNRGLF